MNQIQVCVFICISYKYIYSLSSIFSFTSSYLRKPPSYFLQISKWIIFIFYYYHVHIFTLSIIYIYLLKTKNTAEAVFLKPIVSVHRAPHENHVRGDRNVLHERGVLHGRHVRIHARHAFRADGDGGIYLRLHPGQASPQDDAEQPRPPVPSRRTQVLCLPRQVPTVRLRRCCRR